MNYRNLKKLVKNLKSAFGASKEMKEHYKELYETAIGELRFKNMQTSLTKSIIDEVETLMTKNVSNKLILGVIKNGKERIELDKMIHYNLLFRTK